tara:strand:+ start:206 stop:1090 length:885 start_codon:yes stop_codon:yes gene_type:complete
MTICHNHRADDPFVRFHKNIAVDARLSWKAKGILTYAFSRPNNWKFYKSEILKHSSDGESALDSGLKELENAGYLYRVTNHDKSGRLQGWDWHFFEEPMDPEEFKKFHRNGGFPADGVFPPTVKSPPNKKDLYIKKEENNNKPSAKATASPPPVVVFSCLEDLELSVDFKKYIMKKCQHDDKAKKLVDRVKAWTNREGDEIACNTILSRWDSWTDNENPEDKSQENKKLLQACKKFDSKVSQKTGKKCYVSSTEIVFANLGNDDCKENETLTIHTSNFKNNLTLLINKHFSKKK